MGKRYSELSERLGVSLTGDEVVAIEGLASTSYTASTISAAAADNSINDSAAGLPIITAGAFVNLSAFVDASAELNGKHQVVSSTASKLVVATSITADEAAGAAVTVQGDESYRLKLSQLASYISLAAGDGIAVVYDATGTPALDRVNGEIQLYTMAANTTFTMAMVSGGALTLHVSGGDVYSITWPAATWIGDVPTPAANNIVTFWKVGATLFAIRVGEYA